MNISAVKAYSGQTTSYLGDSVGQSRIINRYSQKQAVKTADNESKASNTDESLISRNEREFFIRMFPANSEQIEKHILFNRNGRLQVPNLSKGSIIDGRA